MQEIVPQRVQVVVGGLMSQRKSKVVCERHLGCIGDQRQPEPMRVYVTMHIKGDTVKRVEVKLLQLNRAGGHS